MWAIVVVIVGSMPGRPVARGRPVVVPAAGTPGCTQVVAPQTPLAGVSSSFSALRGWPFGVASTPNGRWSFVVVDALGPYAPKRQDIGRIAVFSDGASGARLVRVLGVSPDPLLGATVTSDGRYLLIADERGLTGAYVVSTARAERGARDAVIGTLSAAGVLRGGPIEVSVSPDGRYAFVSVEGAGEIAVFNLAAALGDHFKNSSFVGTIPLGGATVGMAISPDGRWLYATSEIDSPTAGQLTGGMLSVIDLPVAERDPGRSVRVSVSAGCGPVRVAVSADGQTVWVTARESNALLGYSAAQLLAAPAQSLVADVPVGQAPVPLAVVDHGDEVIVGDSNRFFVKGSTSQLTVVSTAAAFAHEPAILGSLPSGAFPREMSLLPDGTLLTTDYDSSQLQVTNTAAIP